MASNYVVNVPKLKGRENFAEWSFAVENFLVLEGLSKCISEVIDNRPSRLALEWVVISLLKVPGDYL